MVVAGGLAGVVAVLATVAIERWGGMVGGILGTVPSTIVPASLGFLAESGPQVTLAMGAVPVGMLVNAGFLLLWRLLPGRLRRGSLRRRLLLMVGLSLLGWGMFATLSRLALKVVDGWVSPLVSGGTCTVGLLVMGLWATRRTVHAPRGRRHVPGIVLLSRGVLAATAVGLAVGLSAVNPVVAGFASVFPAIFLTTMVSLWISQDEAVPMGAVGPMVLGSLSVSVYALCFAMLAMPLGGGLAAALAWFVSIATVSVPSYWWLAR